MKKHHWHGAVIIFDDGTASIHKYRAKPDRPVLVDVEGEAPNQAQLVTMRGTWKLLNAHFNFSVAGFCPVLLPYSREILSEYPSPRTANLGPFGGLFC
jgi:hypothetical protein